MAAIDKSEALRYLGHRGQDVPADLSALIDDCMEQCMAAARPRQVSRRFDLSAGMDGLELVGTGLSLPGRDIAAHLAGCSACLLMAATLGVDMDNLIKRYESVDLTRSLILDACAASLIESVCDEAEAALRQQAEGEGKGLTGRYSPGYGDLPLELQPRFTALLDTVRRIGLCCSRTDILLPRKSVTAIMGITDRPPAGPSVRQGCGRNCADCKLTDCYYRKEEAHI
ncbi:MAG: methionine synthase [Clostridiales bacterium]|nr:methionine synthase [Clostridiales bacterium]